ncbi:Protein of unknown function [Kaistia soli DSM 19436]|uniref:DUF3307 domain-containing protein n=1 Tax=Kaistia soli DSM 19436 TaxID=1122133 RepID=A0A1M4V980_9HYPH|nr:DUF3307 domain-containing protein [Kaistia soli]SHE65408.1 Protein of unknown function [Kaistia soli DSM 19436]
MDDTAFAVIAALGLLQVKHLLCDFFIQTPRQIAMKGHYGHLAGIGHAVLHAVATLPIFLVLPTSLPVALAVIVGECVLHYHIDWAKAVIGDRHGWTVRDSAYWRGLGLDQFAHQITYLGIVLVLILVRN